MKRGRPENNGRSGDEIGTTTGSIRSPTVSRTLASDRSLRTDWNGAVCHLSGYFHARNVRVQGCWLVRQSVIGRDGEPSAEVGPGSGNSCRDAGGTTGLTDVSASDVENCLDAK